MPSSATRIVLRQHVTDDDVQGVAWDLDWNAISVGDRKQATWVDAWATVDGATSIHYVHDGPIGMRYFMVRGRDVVGVAQRIVDTCPTWTLANALDTARLATERDDRLIAVYAMALTAPDDPDPAVSSELRRAAADPDPGIRQSVVIATTYLGWPDLVTVVEELQRADPVDDIRHNAGIMLSTVPGTARMPDPDDG